MNIIITIIVGAIAGWLADLAFKRFSLSTLYQILLGIAGAFLGSFLFEGEFHSMLGLPEFLSRVVEAFIGAAVILGLIILYRSLTNKS